MSEKLEQLRGLVRAQFAELTVEDFTYIDPRLETARRPEMDDFYAAIIPNNPAITYTDQTLAALAEYKMNGILARSLAEEFEQTYGPQSEQFLKANFYYNMQVQKFYDTADVWLRKNDVDDLKRQTRNAIAGGLEYGAEKLQIMAQEMGFSQEQRAIIAAAIEAHPADPAKPTEPGTLIPVRGTLVL